MSDPWQTLLECARIAHEETPDFRDFCGFPDDLNRQGINQQSRPAAGLMEADTDLTSDAQFGPFRDAILKCSPLAEWRHTYKDTNIGEDFHNRFGCYELIGHEGAYHSKQMRSFVVYAPAHLHYTWHHHPAEELYLVLAGEAEFAIHGEPSKTLTPGGSVYHASMRPHAMTTHDHPVMAYVLWRGNLTDPPLLTPPDMLIMT